MIQGYGRLRSLLRCAAAGLLGTMLCATAWAQSSIQSLTAFNQGGGELLRIEFSAPPQGLPTGFAIQSPARIALDFPGTANGLGRPSVELNQGNLRSATVVEAGDRTRVVLNLRRPTAYSARVDGNALLVSLEPSAAGAATLAPRPTFAENTASDVEPLRDIDFRRSDDATGRIVVTLPNNRVGVDLRQQGGNLVVEFLKSSLPEGLRRRMDVADFGTPVQAVSTSQLGDRVRMTIEPRGDWEHSAYQSDTQFVVEVRPKKVDVTKLTQGPGYSGERLSLNFQSIDVRALLQVIADFTNFNIVTSDTVVGTLTLRLKDVPWDQALQIIMDAKGLGMRKNGTVLWIAPKDEIDSRTRKDLEAQQAIQNLEPLRTQAYQLNYAKATDMVGQLLGVPLAGTGGSVTAIPGGTNNARFLSQRGSVIAEPRTNQLFVTDTPEKLRQVQELIARLDKAVRQVLIEARIVEASDTFSRSLGVKLGSADLRTQQGGTSGYGVGGGNRLALGTNYNNVVATTGAGGTVDTTSNFVNLPATTATGTSAATFALSIFNASANRFLNLELSALEADGKGKLVSSPRIVTADQTKALIEQGTEFPYQQATASGATSVAFRKANLKLEVTPQITPEGNIILDLDINKDSRGETTTAGIAIDTKHIKTQVLVENGGTVVIGGIFELTQTTTINKVPLLGDIPYLGVLFRNTADVNNKTEMLVFITPKMITDQNAAR
ncbi:type IV pilus secretin PilQ [Xylophilus sp. GOD-11R]|uniref:type IV pilus secretin PilQ n=1 Tax=Xylophilus sp. GOD-11R TaxID=3089814 RepID=UPI00298C6E76|nr:type IV pilus secretin PilQ [Xylophilus sp. GOD-11R]WPB57580.1 type IV pilus secretin PilQ [Xylophilus sp. GOD-11R]